MVKLDSSICDGCGQCLPYCPMGAIVPDGSGRFAIDQDECVECGVCFRSAGCPHGCFVQSPSPWPRSLRALFSNPLSLHSSTQVPGRGTEEGKTNDVTGRFKPGEVGILLELGRPGVGTRFRDVERVTRLLARLGIEVPRFNPLRGLMADAKNGRLLPEIIDEKVLSVVVEFAVEEERLGEILGALEGLAGSLETVCSVGVIRCFVGNDGRRVAERPSQWVEKQGLQVSGNAKVNLGMANLDRCPADCIGRETAAGLRTERRAGQ